MTRSNSKADRNDVLRSRGIKSGCGLVHEHDGWLRDKLNSDCHALAHFWCDAPAVEKTINICF